MPKHELEMIFQVLRRTQLSTLVTLVIIAIAVLTGCVIWLGPSVAADPSLVSTATREGRLAVFDDVWQTLRDRYYDPAFHGVDWASQRTLFRNPAADAPDTNHFYAILRRLIAPLKDSHTR